MIGINRKRALLVSGSIVLLCMAVIVGMTYSLFSDEETVTNHLKAGDLDITLVRTNLTSTHLSERGFFTTTVNEDDKDFTNSVNESVFDLDGELIVPLSKYVAEMQISNNSDVAFGYWLEIVYAGEADMDLAKQISVTVNTEESKRLSEGLTIGSERSPISILAVGESNAFTVAIEFLDMANDISNSAQGDEISFDLVVHAVQYTGADTQ